MQTLLLYGLLALVAPYAIFAWSRRSSVVTFRGDVTVSTVGLMPRMRASVTSYNFVTVFLPDGKTMVMQVSQERLRRLSALATTAYITVVQPLFGDRYIASVKWAGESEAEVGDSKNDGLYLSLSYLMLGMLSLCVVLNPVNQAVLGAYGLAYSASLLALSGWVIGFVHMKPLPADAEMRFLGLVSVGRGRTGLWVAAVAAAALTVGCFYLGGLLCFVAMSAAVAFGQLLAMAAKPLAPAVG